MLEANAVLRGLSCDTNRTIPYIVESDGSLLVLSLILSVLTDRLSGFQSRLMRHVLIGVDTH